MVVAVHHGDCSEVIRTMADGSIDSCVTDPPYALVSIVKRFGKEGSAAAKGGVYARGARGFMGKQWDNGAVAFDAAFWAEVLRVLKPGAYVVAFGGTRTYHRLACAIEDAGFEIRDSIMWHYGSGFPKSHNPAKSLDGKICDCENRQTDHPESNPRHSMRVLRDSNPSAPITAETQSRGVLQQLMPEQDVCGAPSANGGERPGDEAPRQGIEGRGKPRVEGRSDVPESPRELRERPLCEVSAGTPKHGPKGRVRDGAPASDGIVDRQGADQAGNRASHRPRTAEQSAVEPGTVAGQSRPQTGGAWPTCRGCGKPIVPAGLGTSLKPATEIIVLARKPLAGTVAANVLEHGTGAINIDACRVVTGESTVRHNHGGTGNPDYWRTGNGGDYTAGSDYGRWPANIIHDGSEEVVAAFPESDGQQGDLVGCSRGRKSKGIYGDLPAARYAMARGDAGSAARFFYSAKADAGDRCGSKHPTVKPIDLMAYLCRLVTPAGGTVLDPFAGSGTTGMACLREGFNAVLIEREAEYVADIHKRLAHVKGHDTPLFASAEGEPNLLTTMGAA